MFSFLFGFLFFLVFLKSSVAAVKAALIICQYGAHHPLSYIMYKSKQKITSNAKNGMRFNLF